ncbi:MAG: hypothetical protein MUF05_00740 [Candidatus Omnitrophica bacterium]|jgi:hypothetical protein|nr:hypothetical protein [Candidatus Omnitrophota bacterium]
MIKKSPFLIFIIILIVCSFVYISIVCDDENTQEQFCSAGVDTISMPGILSWAGGFYRIAYKDPSVKSLLIAYIAQHEKSPPFLYA